MKYTLTRWRAYTLATVLLIGFIFAACAHAGRVIGDDGFMGSTLSLGGSVWRAHQNDGDDAFVWEELTGDIAIEPELGVGGSFADGLFSFDIGSPDPSFLEPIGRRFLYGDDSEEGFLPGASEFFRNLRIDHPETPSAMLVAFRTDSGDSFFRGHFTETETHVVVYVYVERDVTLAADGSTVDIWGLSHVSDGFEVTMRAGWNALYNVQETVTADRIVMWSISMGNPAHLRWMLNIE